MFKKQAWHICEWRFGRVTSICYKLCYIKCYKYMLEKEVENYLRTQWAKRTRGESIKLPPLFYKGIPDQMCMCWPGWIIYVETKAPQGHLDKAQIVVHDRWRKRGHWVEVAYTKRMVDELIDRVCLMITEYITNLTRIKTTG